MKIVQNVVPKEQEYITVGNPITVTTKEPTSREELRITRTQRNDEDSPRVDIRYFTIRSNGEERPHRGGLRLPFEDAAALRDALNTMQDL